MRSHLFLYRSRSPALRSRASVGFSSSAEQAMPVLAPDVHEVRAERPLQRRRSRCRDARRAFRLPAARSGTEHDELVAAVPGDEVFAARAADEERADVAEDAVAGEVAEGVVDRLEVVEIEQDQVHRPPFRQHAAGLGEEEAAVEQTGELVARGQAVEIAYDLIEPVLPGHDAPRGGEFRGDLEVGRGLAEEVVVAVLQRADLRLGLFLAGEHDGERVAGNRGAQGVDDGEAVGPRHLAVDDGDVEGLAAVDDLDRLAAVAARGHGEAEPPRNVTDPGEVIFVVVGNKGTIR